MRSVMLLIFGALLCWFLLVSCGCAAGYQFPASNQPACSPACTGVQANFIAVAPNHSGGYPLIWCGIDGSVGLSLIQSGVDFPGAGAGRVWHEFYPQQSINTAWSPSPGTFAVGDPMFVQITCPSCVSGTLPQTANFSMQDLNPAHPWTVTASSTVTGAPASTLSSVQCTVELPSGTGVNNTWTGPVAFANMQVQQGGVWSPVNLVANAGNEGGGGSGSGSGPYTYGYPSAPFGGTGSDFNVCVTVQAGTTQGHSQACPYTAVVGSNASGP